MIKGSIKKDIILTNIYATNRGAYMSTQIHKINANRLEGEIDRNTIIVGEFNTPLTPMDRFARQKINELAKILNDAIEPLDLIDVFRTLHPKKNQNTHSFQVHMEHCVLSGHLLGHKTSLNKFKWMGIISFFSDHNDRELEINY